MNLMSLFIIYCWKLSFAAHDDLYMLISHDEDVVALMSSLCPSLMQSGPTWLLWHDSQYTTEHESSDKFVKNWKGFQ